VLVHTELQKLFSGVHFIGLHCTEATIRTRVARRRGADEAHDSYSTALAINDELSAMDVPNLTVIDADRPIEEVEVDVRQWVVELLDRSTTLS